jgi:hypothetical protein
MPGGLGGIKRVLFGNHLGNRSDPLFSQGALENHSVRKDVKKQFRLSASEIRPLATGYGGCFATDMITVEGRKVGYMYREAPDNDVDSGWRFMSGYESDEYMDDADNHAIYDVNTIANYDPDIIPLLNASVNTAYQRDIETGKFVEIQFHSPKE